MCEYTGGCFMLTSFSKINGFKYLTSRKEDAHKDNLGSGKFHLSIFLQKFVEILFILFIKQLVSEKGP